jgi:hypothetical protein
MGPITEEVMRGMFEHVFRARKEPPTTKRHIEDHGFPLIQESAQRPRDQITEDPAVKRRKLTESMEVIKGRKARKLQEKAAEKEEKRLAKEKKKQTVDKAKKTKAAATEGEEETTREAPDSQESERRRNAG